MTSHFSLSLPPEIWHRIIYQLPSSEQKALLEVSRMFHDITVIFLFSSLKIYLVDGEAAVSVLGIYNEELIEENIQKLMQKSWELLYHIIRNQRFAKLVKRLTVVSWMTSEAIFEQLTLAEALLSMSNLKVFRWFGAFPPVTKTIVNRIPKSVNSLVLNSSLPYGTTFMHLSQLVHLSLPTPGTLPPDETFIFTGDMDHFLLDCLERINIEEVFRQLAKPLQGLNILARHISQTPIWIFESLTNLEVYSTIDGPDLYGLELVFRHAIALESLTISGIGTPDLSFLPRSPLDLPRLHSFRLTREREPTSFGDLFSHALCAFLEDRQELRRLCIRMEDTTPEDLSTLLHVVCGLRQLEVFGLHSWFSSNDDTDISILAENLPINLKAFQLFLQWDVTQSSMNSLLAALEAFPELSFLHLTSEGNRVVSLMAETLVTDMKQLDLIGLNHDLWTVRRSEEGATLYQWPTYKTRFCVEEDFDNDDDAWLYKCHQGRSS